MGVSVTSFSSDNSEARGLKFLMHNPHMDVAKSDIFDILSRREAEIFKFKVIQWAGPLKMLLIRIREGEGSLRWVWHFAFFPTQLN